jgi:hypothetical protein
MTLIELLMAVGIGTIVTAAVMALSFYSSRSFVAIGNYVDLDQYSRNAVDKMVKEIRQASALVFYQTNMPKSLVFSYADGSTVTYSWISNSTSSKLVRTTNGISTDLLAGCEIWNFKICQRTPIPNTTNEFYPALNASGGIDMSLCKLVDMSWKSSRTIFGKKANTENVQTAQIVLRNQKVTP